MGALARYIRGKFGVPTRSITNPTGYVEAMTAVREILTNNPDRLMYTVVNLSGNDIYIAWDTDVSAEHGIYLPPNGGNITLTAEEDAELVGYSLYAIANVDNSDIFVISVEGE